MASTDAITFPSRPHTHDEYMKNNIQKIDISKYIVAPFAYEHGDNYIFTFDRLSFVHFRIYMPYADLQNHITYTLFNNLPVQFETNSNFIDYAFYGNIVTPPYPAYTTYLFPLTFDGNKITMYTNKATGGENTRLYVSVNSLLLLKSV